ncbi:MAG: hypothetical protein ACP6IP_01330 [Candidatus Njordarchaeia archaeon]
MAIRTIRDIGRTLRDRRDLKASHGIIIYLIEKYLESLGLIKDKDFRVEENINDLELDIITIDGRGRINTVWEVIEPDPVYNINNDEFLTKIERLLIRTYSIILKPKYIILTDGKVLYVYDNKGIRLQALSLEDLADADDEFEEKIRKIILGLNGDGGRGGS